MKPVMQTVENNRVEVAIEALNESIARWTEKGRLSSIARAGLFCFLTSANLQLYARPLFTIYLTTPAPVPLKVPVDPPLIRPAAVPVSWMLPLPATTPLAPL